MKKEELGRKIIEYEDVMYHIAKSILFVDADCADAIQDTIVKAFEKLHTLKNESYVKTWLVRILINECYDTLRKRRRTVPLEEYHPESEDKLPYLYLNFAQTDYCFTEETVDKGLVCIHSNP